MAELRRAFVDGPALPPICALSGEPATELWTLVMEDRSSGRAYSIKWTIPVTRRAKRIERLRRPVTFFVLLGSIVLYFEILARLEHADGTTNAPLAVAVAVVVAIVAIPLVRALSPRLRLKGSRDGRWITLTGVHPRFVAAARADRAPAPSEGWGHPSPSMPLRVPMSRRTGGPGELPPVAPSLVAQQQRRQAELESPITLAVVLVLLVVVAGVIVYAVTQVN